MAKAIRVKVKYFKRTITNDGTGLATLFLDSEPAYLPSVGDRMLITHTDLPSGSSGIGSKTDSESSNITTALFDEFVQDDINKSINDNYTNFIVAKYEDTEFSTNVGGGNTRGYIEYDVDPDDFDVLKEIETSVIVSERVAYDGSTGKNSSLSGTTTGMSQTTSTVMPMVFVDRSDTNTKFANLYQAFNLPSTREERKEYEQSSLGNLTKNTTNGEFLINGVLYDWASSVSGTTVHPSSGYTGRFYGTAYEKLNNSRALFIEIPKNQYGEIIDGKSIKLTLPSSLTGSTYDIYSAYKKNSEVYTAGGGLDQYLSEIDLNASSLGSPVDLGVEPSEYESNIALLFCDDIKRPLGATGGTWSTGHSDVLNGTKVYSPDTAIDKEFFDFYDDEAVGVAYLDKGFIVITHPTIVDSITNDIYTAGDSGNTNVSTTYIGTAANLTRTFTGTGTTINDVDWDNTQFLFASGTGVKAPTAEYLSYNTEKSLNVVCLASADEFFRTTNPTAKNLLGLEGNSVANLKTGSSTIYPALITGVGLYDEDGNLLAVCKPQNEIQKQWYDVQAFNIKIKL